MGAPMARHLADAGHEIVTVLNRSPLPAYLKASVLASPAEVARVCEIVITMLPDTLDVERVLLGPGGVLEGISAGKLVIDMSSISPIATAEFAAKFREAGAGFPRRARIRRRGRRQGGESHHHGRRPAAEFERALLIFEKLGKNITLIVEKNGAGQTCKIANQIIVALNIGAVAEALVFASKAGCDPAKVRSALMGGFASSRALEVHGERMIARTFAPGFRIRLHQKDLNLALESARALGAALPSTALAQQLMNSCAARPDGAEADHSSLVRALEVLSDHELSNGKE